MKPRNEPPKNPAAGGPKAASESHDSAPTPLATRQFLSGSAGALLFGFGLFIVTFIAYWPALHGGFIWDDETHITGNLTLRSLHGLREIWVTPGATCQYYPLTFSVFWLEYHLWQLQTPGYHVVNVLLHATAAILLWQVLQRLKVRGAWLAGAIFALHPVCVMSVAWMTETKNTLSATLALCAAWAYVRAAGLGVYADKEFQVSRVKFQGSGNTQQKEGGWDWRFYVLSLALFQLALFAKTAVSFLPVTLLLVAWWQGRRLNWRTVWPVLPMLAMAVAMGLVTIFVERTSGGASGERFDVSAMDRILISGRSFWFYLGKLFFPYHLTFIYPRWAVSIGQWWQCLFPLAMVGVLAGLWRWRGKIGKGLFVALAHFYVSTSVLILMVVLYMTRYSFVSDHWQYFGSMGVIAVVAAGIVWALDRFGKGLPFLKPVVCGAVLLVLGALTSRQCGMYTDLKTLWTVTLERNPDCSIAHNDLGGLLLDEGRVDAAAAHFQQVLATHPEDVVANYNMGSILMKKGRSAEALASFQRALKGKPNDAETCESVGNLLMQAGRVNEATDYLRRAVELQPGNPTAHYNLANALMHGHVDEAILQYQQDLAINPRDGMACANLGNALLEKDRLDEALEQFARAAKFMPDSALAHAAFGNALLQKGKLDAAVDEFEKALKLQPDFPLAKSRLLTIAWIWATHPADEFRNGILALRLSNDLNQMSNGHDAAVLGTLAAADAEVENYPDAISTASRALDIASAQSNADLAAKLREQLGFYKSSQPFRDAGDTNQLHRP